MVRVIALGQEEINNNLRRPPPLRTGRNASHFYLTFPSVMYLQFIFRNFTSEASSSSEVEDKTLSIGFEDVLAKSASLK